MAYTHHAESINHQILDQKTVLIVDDSSLNITLIENIVKAIGHQSISARTGLEALHILSEQKPDLIALDIMMPEMDGFELLQHIKQIPELTFTPVIFISSLDEPEYRIKGLLEGGYDYITKPLKVAEVKARILTALRIQSLQESLYREKEYLAVLNQGLTHFTAIASHDLQAPVRKIVQLSEILLSSAHDRLTEEDCDILSRIGHSAQKMQAMVQDLLQLSKLESQPQDLQTVDLNILISDILAELKEEIEQSKADVVVNQLPVIQADSGMLRQLFLNFISNALKFVQQGVAPVIRISAAAPADKMQGLQISISDNGIGIESRHLDKLFKPFQRLQAASPYSGTGLGLYICQKIAERHGGNITVRSTPGSGSTFTVTLPI